MKLLHDSLDLIYIWFKIDLGTMNMDDKVFFIVVRSNDKKLLEMNGEMLQVDAMRWAKVCNSMSIVYLLVQLLYLCFGFWSSITGKKNLLKFVLPNFRTNMQKITVQPWKKIHSTFYHMSFHLLFLVLINVFVIWSQANVMESKYMWNNDSRANSFTVHDMKSIPLCNSSEWQIIAPFESEGH